MMRPRLMEQVERAAQLYDEEVKLRERGRQWESKPTGYRMAEAYFVDASKAREQRLEILRRAGLL